MSPLPALGVGVALLMANAFFVAAEFALIAARRSRIEQLAAAGDRRGRSALAGLRQLSLMLAGAQLGITMASLGLGAVAEPAVAHFLEDWLEPLGLPAGLLHPVSFVLALGLVVFVHMVVGEMAPKSWAISHPEDSALLLARPFRAFVLVFRPVIGTLNALANGVVRACGVEPQDERAMAHSAGDLALLIRESGAHGGLEATSVALASASLGLSGLDALAAMTPRRQVVSVPAEATADTIEATAARSGRSRLLVVEGDLDRVVGVVHVRDALVLPDAARPVTTARALAHPVAVTHESHALEDLLLDMRTGGRHFAVVVDELGSVAGVVTLEDVLEELIGDFDDESDRSSRRIHRREDGSWVVAGTTRPDELEASVGLALPRGEWETLAGFLIAALDRIPALGDTVPIDSHLIEVTRMDGYAVAEVSVRRRQAGEGDRST